MFETIRGIEGRRAAVDEQPPRPGQPHGSTSRASRVAAPSRRDRDDARAFDEVKCHVRIAAPGDVDGRSGASRHQQRRRQRQRARGGRHARPTGPGARAQYRTARGGRLFEVERAGELAGALVEQRREVRAGERLRTSEGRGCLHPRRRARCRRARRLATCARPPTALHQRAGEHEPRSAPRSAISRWCDCRSDHDLRRCSSIARRSAPRSASASTRRFSPTAIFSTTSPSCPSSELERYAPAFERVARSIRLNDVR